MRNFTILNAALIGTSIALIQPHVAVAISQQEVEQIAQQITVQIVDAQNSYDSGSGVIIKQVGNTYTVITAYHVVDRGTKNIIAPDKQSYQIKNIKQLKGKDLAVVEFSSNQKYTVAKIGNSDKVIKQNIVYVAGFPGKTAAAPNVDFRIKDGKVDAKGTQGDGYDINYDNRTSGGMSGGGVFNEQGELIAIHGRANTEPSEENPEVQVISGALGTSIYSALRQLVAVGVDVGVKPSDVVATAPTADDFFIKGNEKASNKDYRGAIADYNQAIKINPNYANIYYNRGVTRYELGDKQGAIADYNQALKINPNLAEAYANRGVVRHDLGDKQGAIADYTQALKINPNYADAYYNRGNAHKDLGDKQGAIADYTQALKINPNYAQAYYNRGIVRSELGDKQGAIADYTQAIKINPNYAQAYYNRGIVRDDLGDNQGAITDYNQALKINPNDADAYYNRGIARDDLGDKQGAIADYNQAIKINPNYAKAYYNRGIARDDLGDKQGALADYNQAIKINPNYAQAYGNRGIVRNELGDKQGAIQDLHKAGELFKQQGRNADYERAMKAIEQIQNQR
jgi:tetratricopeptide (TPR) repeat protein